MVDTPDVQLSGTDDEMLSAGNYLRQGGNFLARLCLSVCLSVCVLAR